MLPTTLLILKIMRMRLLCEKIWDWLFELKIDIRTFLSKENETDTKIVFETNSFLMENEFVSMAGAPVVTTV